MSDSDYLLDDDGPEWTVADTARQLALDLQEVEAERDRLRAVVVDWLDAVARAESPAVTQAALDHLGAMVGWQLDGTGNMGGRADDPTVSSGADSGEYPRTTRPNSDVRHGGHLGTAGLSLADQTLVGDESSAGKASPLLTSGGEPSSSPADRGAGASTTGAPPDEPVIGTASTRDLQRVLVGVFTAMFPPTRTDGPGTVDYTDLPGHVREVVRQRDQLQAAYQTLLRRFLPDEYEAWQERRLHGDESSPAGVPTDDGHVLGEPDPEDGFRPVYTQAGEHVGWAAPGDSIVEAMHAAIRGKAERGETVVVSRDGKIIEVPAAELLDESSAGGVVPPVHGRGDRDPLPVHPQEHDGADRSESSAGVADLGQHEFGHPDIDHVGEPPAGGAPDA